MIGFKACFKVLVVALIMVACGAGTAGATGSTVVDTTASNWNSPYATPWDGVNSQGYFGVPDPLSQDMPTFGQVVTAPSNTNALTSFTFYMGQDPNYGSGTIYFKAYVYAWDNNNYTTSGTALWSGVPFGTPTGNNWGEIPYTSGSAGVSPVTFNLNVPVQPNSEYVLFASITGYDGSQGPNNSYGIWGMVLGGGTSDVWAVAGDDQGWYDYMSMNAFAMQATFANASAVPLPGAIFLLAPGLLGVAAVKRRLRKGASQGRSSTGA